MASEESGSWLINKLINAAETLNTPLSSDDIKLLKKSFWDLQDSERAVMRDLNNRIVNIARSAMETEKAAGVPTIKVRWRLRLPEEWVNHYNNIYKQELPWLLSAILQNAMLQNPMAGERSKWKSP